MAPSTSKSPARASGGGGKQSTLLGFFGKAAATTPAKPSPKSTASGSAATPSRTPARPASARPTPNGSSSSVSSSSSTSTSTLSSLGSVDQRAATAAAAATTPSASKKRAAAGGPASSTARTAAVAATKPLSSRLTPPASSDPDGMDIDEDDEDLMPVRRRSAAKRTISYAESDDEAGGGGGETDSEADEDGGSFSPSASKKRRSSGGRTLKRSRTARDDDNFIVSDNDVEEEEEEDDDDERALAATDDDSEDEAPLSKKAPSRAKAKAAHADTSPRPSSLGGFRMGSGPSSRPSPSSSSGRLDQPGRPALGSRPTPPGGPSLSHLTKAERRVIEEKRKRAENEQAYSFLVDLRDKDGKRPGEPDYDPRTVHIPASAWKDFTPFEVQFWKIKQNHFDTVLFFQKGKFYELYEDDALIGHREFDLKLTDRVKMKMVGVPESSFDMFAAKFLALGYKVGRVDQTETAVAKGMRVGEKSRGGGGEIVNRELRHVLTSGTIVDASALPDDLNSYCVSIKEVERAASAGADGGPRFGVCTLDASTAEFNLSEFDDDASRTRLETLLRSLRLKEVLHEKGGLSPATARVLRNTVPAGCQTTMLKPGSEFLDAEATRDRLDGLFGGGSGGAGGECGNDDDEGGDGGATAAAAGLPQGIASMLDRDAAMSALGAMLSYLATLNLERDLCSSRNFNIFDPLRQDRCMVLDAQSLTHLNVLQNDQGTDVGTLHRLLNRCATPFGKRLFKIWMVAPLADIDAIRARQDAVDDFLGCPAFEEAFDAFARQLPDIERIIPRIYAGKCRPKDFTRVLTAFGHFRESVERLRALAESFAGEGGGRVAALLASIPDVTALAGELRSRFQLADDGSFTPRRGVFAPYDEAEAALLAIEAQLEDELQACRRLLKLNAARCGWKHLGTKDIYQIEVPATTKVPASWVKLSGTKDRHRFYSPEVRDLVQELKEARETRLAALKQFHAALFAEFVAESARYVEAVKAIAEVDCLLSLAKASYAIGEPTCRPELVEHDTALVEFDELRHPCIAEGVDFIPNDIRLGGDSDEVVILTGGNMAGKSTTARTTATAVIIAQLGCRVPALRARISPVDRIASRMGANDQIFRNNSTFMVEMLEASRIVRECTPRSLVVMDELGRGTSTFDGQAIAFAVLHHLVSRTRCLSFFLTHYTSLAYDFQGYPRVSNKHLQVLVDDDRREVVFTYRLVDGVAESSYGTQVAALAGVPHEICDRAAAVSKQFLESTKEHLARREQSRIPLATLSDFTHLVRLADDPAAANAGVNVGAGGSTSASDGSGAARMAAVAASQLAVIRAQVKSLASAAASSAPPGQHGERGKAAALAARPDVALIPSAMPVSVFGQHERKTPAIGKTRAATTYAGRARRMRSDELPSDDGPASLPSTPTKRMRRSVDVATASSFGPIDTEGDNDGDGHGDDGDVVRRSLSSPVTSRSTATTSLLFGGARSRRHQAAAASATAAAAKRSEQLILDLGQRIRVVCNECGMQYDTSSPEDGTLHAKYHDRTIKGVDWTSKCLLAAGREVASFRISDPKTKPSVLRPSGSASAQGRGTGADAGDEVRILCYELGQVKEAVATRKLTELMASVDEALGASTLPDSTLKACKLFVAVKAGRGVGAALVGRVALGTARRVVGGGAGGDVDQDNDNDNDNDKENRAGVAAPRATYQVLHDGGEAIFVSEPLSASATPPIGVHRIHVIARFRRSGLASRLLDAAADHSVYGLNLARLEQMYGGRAGTVAFSQPTDAGRKLAERWIRSGGGGGEGAAKKQDGRLVVYEG